MSFVPDRPLKFTPDAAPPEADPIGEANAAAEKTEQGPVQDIIDMLKAVPSGILPMLQGLGKNVTDHPILGNLPGLADTFARVAADPKGTLTSVSSALSNATPAQVGKNVIAPLAVGGLASKGVGLTAGLGDAAATEAQSAAGQLGLRTTTARPIYSAAAGPTAGPTLDIQNQGVASKVLGADAGVPHDVPVNHTSLAAAAVKPGELLDQAAATLPAAPLSVGAQAKVLAARGPKTITPGTPDVDNYVNATEAKLNDPNAQFSGSEIRATRNLLSGEAATGRLSADPAQRALAKYKQGIVGALDQHVADTMPANSAISPEMIANARETLAKNYNLRDLIGKGGDLDLQGLAADHRANPNKFTGPTRTVAQFASDHPEVTGNISDAQRIAPPSLVGDLNRINIINPRSWVQPLLGTVGRAGLRGTGALDAAARTPVAGLGGEFDPLPMNALQPPPGRAFEPHQPQAATGAPTELPFEQHAFQLREPPGQAFEPHQPQLAAGGEPFQPPLGLGAPFRPVSPGTSFGGLSVAPEPRTYGGQPAANQDLGAVMSSQVPDNILARSQPSSAPEFEKLGQPLVDHEVRPDDSHVFTSPNGSTTTVRLPDGNLKVVDTTTDRSARGTGQGTARIEAAANFAHDSGAALVSDNEVSAPEQRVYDSLKRRGFDVRENANSMDPGTGVKKATSELKGVYEIHPPLGASYP